MKLSSRTCSRRVTHPIVCKQTTKQGGHFGMPGSHASKSSAIYPSVRRCLTHPAHCKQKTGQDRHANRQTLRVRTTDTNHHNQLQQSHCPNRNRNPLSRRTKTCPIRSLLVSYLRIAAKQPFGLGLTTSLPGRRALCATHRQHEQIGRAHV